MVYFSTEHLRRVFEDEDKYTSFKNLTYDLNRGNDIIDYDAETGVQRKISKAEANDKVRSVIFEILDLTDETVKSKKARHRALNKHWAELFEVIEEEIDFKIEEGFKATEWFNQFVESKNLKLGDANEFWTEEKAYLTVAEVARGHHDLTLQTLGEGQSFSVTTSVFAVKVGYDIDLILLGKVDFSKFIDKIAEAFLIKIQAMMYDEVISADGNLPAQFKKSGTLGSATKTTFDDLLADVSIANGVDVVIMGTKNALKKLTALADVTWASDAQKYEVNSLGRLGNYEGTTLIEIPQRFKIGDTGTKLVDDKKLLIMPQVSEKFVKFVDVGETETFEVTEKGDLRDDFQTYEVRREMGISTLLGQYFGSWTIV